MWLPAKASDGLPSLNPVKCRASLRGWATCNATSSLFVNEVWVRCGWRGPPLTCCPTQSPVTCVFPSAPVSYSTSLRVFSGWGRGVTGGPPQGEGDKEKALWTGRNICPVIRYGFARYCNSPLDLAKGLCACAPLFSPLPAPALTCSRCEGGCAPPWPRCSAGWARAAAPLASR